MKMELEIIKKTRLPIQEALHHLEEEFRTLHTGKAQTSLVEGIAVDYYGAKTPLKNMAQISVPAPNQIIVQPWDKNSLGDIEVAIRNSDLGLNPVNTGQNIRLTLPPLTEERRKELTKMVHTKAEEARVSIRNIRQRIWSEVQNKVQTSQLTEDDKFQIKDGLQKLVEEFDKKIAELAQNKEKEIMTV